VTRYRNGFPGFVAGTPFLFAFAVIRTPVAGGAISPASVPGSADSASRQAPASRRQRSRGSLTQLVLKMILRTRNFLDSSLCRHSIPYFSRTRSERLRRERALTSMSCSDARTAPSST
jgi:hypothetical protein